MVHGWLQTHDLASFSVKSSSLIKFPRYIYLLPHYMYAQVCSESARLTHYHISGVNGALLIAMSVKLALQTNGTVDPVNFVDSLLGKIAPFEEEFLTSSQPNQPGDDDSHM